MNRSKTYFNLSPLLKLIFFLFIVLSKTTQLSGQNLVLNPSFEENGFCDHSVNNRDFFVHNWFMVYGGYMNACSPLKYGSGVPENHVGYQHPHSGNAYVALPSGIASKKASQVGNLLYGQLKQSLEKENDYYVRFYVNKAFGKTHYNTGIYKWIYKNYFSISSMSLYFSKDSMQDTTVWDSINPQIKNPPTRILNDTFNWMPITGIYHAAGGERYITIGNFLRANKTDYYLELPKNISPTDSSITYFIDDVSVLPLPHFPKDTFVCEGNSLKLETHLPGFAHQWQDGSSDSTLTITHDGTYWVNIRLDSVYSYSDTISVHFNSMPEISLPRELRLCQGETKKITLPNKYTYIWENADTSSEREFSSQGTYFLQTRSHACIRWDTLTVQVDSIPQRPLPEDTIMCDGVPLQLHISSPYSIKWPDGSANSTFTIAKSGDYLLTITNQCGVFNFPFHVDSKSCLPVVYFPNAFSPNADHTNDSFTVFGQNILSIDLYIYNRWGEQIFHTKDKQPYWNGMSAGKAVPEGIYYYYAHIKGITGNKNMSGIINVIR